MLHQNFNKNLFLIFLNKITKFLLYLFVFLGILASFVKSGDILIIDKYKCMNFDVIIVLGSPANQDGTPSYVMKYRVEKAIDLFDQGCASRVLFTGGAVKNQFIEAEIMARYAGELGLPQNVILQEKHSTNTIENAKNSISIMLERKWNKAAIVTSPYHTRRTMMIFEYYGKDMIFSVIPSDYPPHLNLIPRLREIFHEYVNIIIWYYFRNFS